MNSLILPRPEAAPELEAGTCDSIVNTISPKTMLFVSDNFMGGQLML